MSRTTKTSMPIKTNQGSCYLETKRVQRQVISIALLITFKCVSIHFQEYYIASELCVDIHTNALEMFPCMSLLQLLQIAVIVEKDQYTDRWMWCLQQRLTHHRLAKITSLAHTPTATENFNAQYLLSHRKIENERQKAKEKIGHV